MELRSRPAQTTINFYPEGNDDFMKTVKQSVNEWNRKNTTNQNSGMRLQRQKTTFDRRPQANKCKYQEYMAEVEDGKFDATPEDLKDLNLDLTLDPEGCYIIPNRDIIVRTPTERVDASIERYSNLSMVDRIRKAAEERVHAAYTSYMGGRCQGLIENQKRIVSVTKKRKRNDEPKKQEVLMKIKEINQDLEAIRKANASLERQIELLEKAKATLVLEESGAAASIQYEKQKLSGVIKQSETNDH